MGFRSAPILSLLLACALIGCQKADSNASVAPIAPVEKAVVDGKEVTAAGIRLTFPKDWNVVNMSQGELETGLDTLSKNPRGAEMIQAAKTLAQSAR